MATIHIHGGGFTGGSKDTLVERVPPYAARGYVAIAVQYRLAGEAKWPSQIEDVKAAIRWARANAKSLGFDPEKIAVVGHSAGGLATLLAASKNRRIVLWVGLDPVDSGDIGAKAADDRIFTSLVLLAEPSRCNQRENISGLKDHLRGPWLIAKVDGAGHCDPEEPTDKWCTFTCGGGYSDRRHSIFVRHTLDALDAVLRNDPAATERLNNLKKDKNLKEIRGPGIPAARLADRAARAD
jgi:acetyl esterase/lipase